MRRTTPQERAVYDILRDLGVNVAELEHPAPAHECTFAVFVNDVPLRKPTRQSGKAVRHARVSINMNAANTIGVCVPDWATTAQGFIALNPIAMRSAVSRRRLKDALRSSCRLCTQRVRQLDHKRRVEAKRNLERQKAA